MLVNQPNAIALFVASLTMLVSSTGFGQLSEMKVSQYAAPDTVFAFCGKW